MLIVDGSERARKSIALLTFTVGGRSSQCFGRIGVRGYFQFAARSLRQAPWLRTRAELRRDALYQFA
jgi:hypothetical protein